MSTNVLHVHTVEVPPTPPVHIGSVITQSPVAGFVNTNNIDWIDIVSYDLNEYDPAFGGITWNAGCRRASNGNVAYFAERLAIKRTQAEGVEQVGSAIIQVPRRDSGLALADARIVFTGDVMSIQVKGVSGVNLSWGATIFMDSIFHPVSA